MTQEHLDSRGQLADLGVELGDQDTLGKVTRIARELEQPPEYRTALGGSPLEAKQANEPLERLDRAPVTFRRMPQDSLRLREIVLLERDLSNHCLRINPSWMAFAHAP